MGTTLRSIAETTTAQATPPYSALPLGSLSFSATTPSLCQCKSPSKEVYLRFQELAYVDFYLWSLIVGPPLQLVVVHGTSEPIATFVGALGGYNFPTVRPNRTIARTHLSTIVAFYPLNSIDFSDYRRCLPQP